MLLTIIIVATVVCISKTYYVYCVSIVYFYYVLFLIQGHFEKQHLSESVYKINILEKIKQYKN